MMAQVFPERDEECVEDQVPHVTANGCWQFIVMWHVWVERVTDLRQEVSQNL
jgi:hypothetical protein